MPAKPPSDDPQLPKLRRFRLESDGSKVAREAVPDAPTAPAPEVSAEPFTYDDPDALLRATEPRTSLKNVGASSPPPPHATLGTAPRRAKASLTGPTTMAESSASTTATLPELPVSGSSAGSTTGRSRLAFILGGVAVLVVLAVVAWLVLKPSAAQKHAADEGSTDAQSPTAVTVVEWADGMCAALGAFETKSMPVRAAAIQASGGTPSSGQIAELQRQSSTLLSELAEDVKGVGMPKGSKEAATLHTELLATITTSVNEAKGTGGPIGSPRDRAESIVSALDEPITTFIETIDDLGEATVNEIAQAPTCKDYL